jgi:regulation of enolase protein 1 (concanavalin A-like superfamily)
MRPRRRKPRRVPTGRPAPVWASAANPVERLEPRQLLSGSLTALKTAAPGSVNEMLLLGNGSVLCQLSGGAGWAILTPSSTGSYINGTWSRVSNAHATRTYYSSQVLENGSVYVAGGEYGSGAAVGEVYNPTTNTWTLVPTGVGSYIDADSEILANGDVLEAPVYPASSGYTYLYNPTTNAWTTGPKMYRGSDADEQNWVKLADGSILAPDGAYTSERYIPASNTWVNDATSTTSFTDGLGEFGTGVLLPNGKAFYVGSSSNTEIYTPSGTSSPGTWTEGPTLPSTLGQDDAPMAVLPDGMVLFAVGPVDSYNGPTTFDIYNYLTNTITAATNVPTVSGPPYINRFLDLPDGTTLISSTSSTVYDYSDGGTALTAPTPTITSIAHQTNGSYLLTGTQLNGNSEGAYYGDDAQMNSNYPMVRLTSSGGTVYFANSYDWSSDGVDTGTTPETTDFTLPLGLPAGTYTVNVMVNGFISASSTLTTPAVTDTAPTVATAAAASPAAPTGLTTTLSVLGASANGASTLTYTWVNTSAPSGDSTASFSVNGTNAASSTTATFQQAGTYVFKVTITDADGLSVTSSVTVVVAQTLSSVVVSPTPANLTAGQTQQLSATGYDQFGNAMSTQPTFTWALASGGGTVSSSGLYTSPSSGTLAQVTATTGSLSGTASVYVVSAPWVSADVGSPGVTGTAYDSSGTFTVSGSGSDVWGTSDQFHYVYRPLGGDGEITAEVVSEANPLTAWEKAGVMIRDTLDASSQQAFMAITPGNGAAFQYRTTAGGSSTNDNTTGPVAPYWVKLVRSGNTFTGYYSANGTTWTKEASATIAMSASVYVGLFVVSQSNTAASTVTFSNVSLLDAAPDTLTVNPGVAGTVNVLTNDVGPTGSTLTVTAVTQGSKGTVTFTAAGLVTYTSTAAATGSDTFTYTISDGLGDTATSTVTVSILGLQAYYKMNEGTGATTADATGDGYTATLSGATWTTGVDGSDGLAFSGSGEYASAPALNLDTNTVTLSGWLYRTGAEASSAGIIMERNGNDVAGLDFYNSTTLGYTWGTSASPYNFNSGLSPAVDVWTFVALVVTPTNATFYMEPLGGTLTSAVQTLAEPVEGFTGTTGIGEDPGYTTRDYTGSMDEVRIYNTALSLSGITAIANIKPTVATAAAASPSPVTGTTTALSVLGADYNGESALTYTWAATTIPTGATAPTFSVDGTNGAKATTATFSKAGAYTFTVTIADAAGLSTTSVVNVTVNETTAKVSVSPAAPTLVAGATQQFSAVAYDQFGVALSPQPTVAWSLTGSGSISSTGLYTTPSGAGSAVVTATANSVAGSTTVTIGSSAPTVATPAAATTTTVTGTTVGLTVLGASASGESTLTYTWSATSGPSQPTFSPNGTNAAKASTATFTQAGTYTLTVVIANPQGATVSSSVIVTVVSTLTGVSLSNPSVAPGGTSLAMAVDQFGAVLAASPTWTATGGTITGAGAFTAGTTAGAYAVTATVGSASVHAAITVVPTTFTGTTGNDTYIIRISPTSSATEQVFVDTAETGTPTYTVPWSQLSTMSFTAASDGSLTVDFANGNPLPAQGLTYSGGNGLFVEGVAAGSMSFTVNATQLVDAAASSSPIAYSGIKSIELDLAGGSNTLTQSAQPAAAITYDAGAGNNTLDVTGGTFTFPGNPAAASGSLTVNDSAAVVVAAPAPGAAYAPVSFAALNLTGTGTATLATSTTATDRTVLETSALSVATGAKLDLGENALIVHNGVLSTLAALVKSGDASGTWAGTGITSSAAAGDSTDLTAVGLISNNNGGTAIQATFDGQPVAATDVLARYTYYGDVNLDGDVNAADYTRVDAGFVLGLTGWANGDFNYDGVVDGSDYTLMDNAFNMQYGQLPTTPLPPTPLPTPVATPIPAAPTPTALYTFDEGTATDVTGDGFNGTVGGATPTLGVDATKGLAFSGKSSASLPALNLQSDAVTLTGWVERTGAQTNGAGLIFNRTAGSGNGLTVVDGDQLGYSWGTSTTFDSGLVLPNGQWTFVALVVSPGEATVYMEQAGGAMQSATHAVANPAEPFDGATTLGEDPLGSRFFVGTMDQVGIYDQALSASAVAALADLAPTITQAAYALPSQAVSFQTALTVLATTQDPANTLTYTWDATSAPAGATVSYTVNGSPGAYSTTATGSEPGTYTFTVTVSDPDHLTTTSSVSITFDGNPADLGDVQLEASPKGEGIVPDYLGNLYLDSPIPAIYAVDASPSDHWVLVLDSLTIVGPYSQLDLGDADMIIRNDNLATAEQTLATVTGYIKSGYGLGGAANWTYGGLVSGLAAANPTMALGIMLNRNAQGQAIYTTWDGQPVNATDVLVKYTRFGDANLDGTVNGADAALLASGMKTGTTGWYNGDFNYDGVVNGADVALLDASEASEATQATAAAEVATAAPAASIAPQVVDAVPPTPQATLFSTTPIRSSMTTAVAS